MTIYPVCFTAKSLEFFLNIQYRHNLITKSVILNSIVVYKNYHIIQSIFYSGLNCFPNLSFICFTVSDQAEYPAVDSIPFKPQCHSDSS